MRTTSRCVLDRKPVAHINQSHCVFPSLTMGRRSAPLIPKRTIAKPTPSDGAEVVGDLCEDAATGVGVWYCKIGGAGDGGGIGQRVVFGCGV